MAEVADNGGNADSTWQDCILFQMLAIEEEERDANSHRRPDIGGDGVGAFLSDIVDDDDDDNGGDDEDVVGEVTPMPMPESMPLESSTLDLLTDEDYRYNFNTLELRSRFLVDRGDEALPPLKKDPAEFRDVPEPFLCPISFEVMKDPVMDCDGHTFERENITAWILNGNGSGYGAMYGRQDPPMSPITRNPYENTRLVPNQALREMIYQFMGAEWTKDVARSVELDGTCSIISVVNNKNVLLPPEKGAEQLRKRKKEILDARRRSVPLSEMRRHHGTSVFQQLQTNTNEDDVDIESDDDDDDDENVAEDCRTKFRRFLDELNQQTGKNFELSNLGVMCFEYKHLRFVLEIPPAATSTTTRAGLYAGSYYIYTDVMEVSTESEEQQQESRGNGEPVEKSLQRALRIGSSTYRRLLKKNNTKKWWRRRNTDVCGGATLGLSATDTCQLNLCYRGRCDEVHTMAEFRAIMSDFIVLAMSVSRKLRRPLRTRFNNIIGRPWGKAKK